MSVRAQPWRRVPKKYTNACPFRTVLHGVLLGSATGSAARQNVRTQPMPYGGVATLVGKVQGANKTQNARIGGTGSQQIHRQLFATWDGAPATKIVARTTKRALYAQV